VAAGVSSVAEFELATNGDLVIRTGTAGKKLFKFDRVFSPQDNQGKLSYFLQHIYGK
jgi:kinesin family protein C2/C3